MSDLIFEKKIEKLYKELGGEKEYERLRLTASKENLQKLATTQLEKTLRSKYSINLPFDLELKDFTIKKDKVYATYDLSLPDKQPIQVSTSFQIEDDGKLTLIHLDNEKEIEKILGYKYYAVKVPGYGVYKVSALTEKEAVNKVIDKLFEEVSSVEVFNRRFVKGNRSLLCDYILDNNYVMDWKKYIDTKDIVDFKEKEVLPKQVIKLEKQATVYPESLLLQEERSFIDRFFTEQDQKIYSFIRKKETLKKTIASIIENYLKQFGIDAEVEINKMEGEKVITGTFELTSSYVSGEFPFVADVEGDEVKLISIRDYEIKKVAGLKIYKVGTPEGKEFTILATSLPVVLETLQTILNRKISFDEFTQKFTFTELGEFGVINDAKQVNPWTKIKVGEEEFLVRLK
jgi:hypothetical protein